MWNSGKRGAYLNDALREPQGDQCQPVKRLLERTRTWHNPTTRVCGAELCRFWVVTATGIPLPVTEQAAVTLFNSDPPLLDYYLTYKYKTVFGA